MVKHTQKIRRQFADELLECVLPFCGVGAKRVNFTMKVSTTVSSTNHYTRVRTYVNLACVKIGVVLLLAQF